jgi:glycosidase
LAGQSGAGGTGGAGALVETKPVIYQLVVRHFGNLSTGRIKDGTIAQNGVGKFEDVNAAALASLKALGMSHVWYTGVLRQATLTDHSDVGIEADDADVIKGRAGSFYAVRDYYDVSPDYAADKTQRLAEFKAMVDRTHAAGLDVLIDLVPNHVARGYHSVVKPETDFGSNDDRTVFFSPQNNFFYVPAGQPLTISKPATWTPAGATFDTFFGPEDGTLGKQVRVTGNAPDGASASTANPSEYDWYETIKLNYGRDFRPPNSSTYDPLPSTWVKMNDIIAYWQEMGVDGFRCDFAHFVPDEAWQYLIGEARKRNPKAYFLAEAYANLPGLLADGFDAVYNDELYDTVRSMYRGQASPTNLRDIFNKISGQDRARFASYLENHDECRLAAASACDGNGAFFSSNAVRQLGPLMYLATNGPVLLYNGQEVGEDGAGDEGFGGEDARTSIFDYWSLPKLQAWSNGHLYDGANLDSTQQALRKYYGDIFNFARDPLVRGGGFRELLSANATVNNVFAFARYDASQPGRLLVVVVNFQPGAGFNGAIKLPADLLDTVGIAAGASKTLKTVFTNDGAVASPMALPITREALVGQGLQVQVPDQAGLVYLIE